MRMWMIPPELMCPQHITGEHNEIHKHLPDLYKGKSIKGRINPVVQIELANLKIRHDELAKFLNHKSPLEIDDYLIWRNYPQYYFKKVNIEYNIKDLSRRCLKCREKLGTLVPTNKE